MERHVSRCLHLIVAVILAVSLVPASAFAAPESPASEVGSWAGTERGPGIRPSGVLPLAADDDIPGIALGASPVAGSLSGNDDDYVDVYSFTMTPGQVFSAELTMPAGRSFYMELFDSSGSTVYDYTGLVEESLPWDATHDRIHVATTNTSGGTYYLAVWGDDNPYYGAYTLNWTKYTRSGDDEVTGAISPVTTPVAGSLDWRTDASDVYRFDLLDDQVLTLTLSAGSGAASTAYPVGGFSMYAYPAGTTTVWGDVPTWGASTLDEGTNAVTKSYYCPPGGAGTIYVELHADMSAANYNLAWAVSSPSTVRLSGYNRYETSLEISKANFVSSGKVVLASGTSFADALCASGLAGALDAPLLLLPPKILDGGFLTDDGRAFRDECLRLGVTEFAVVGGVAAISAELLDDAKLVTGVSTATRYSGADRYATSADVMNKIVNLNGGPTDVALVARGDKFADALAAAPYAYANGYPILLTRTDALPGAVRTSLQSLTPGTAYVLGGTAAVSGSVFAELDSIVATVERKDGADRYATALNFATFVVDGLGAASWAQVGLATGVNFPDALSGGAAVGSRGGVLLLTPPDALDPAVGAKLTYEAAGVDRVSIFGGTAAVSAAVRSQVEAILAP